MRTLARTPILLYRAGLGWLMGNRFIMLTHIGRKSGLPRQVVVEVVRYDAQTGTTFVASAWGKKSDWCRNICKAPQVTVHAGRRRAEAVAQRLPPEEAVSELAGYARRHPVAARILARLLGSPSGQTDFAALSQQFVIIALRPRVTSR